MLAAQRFCSQRCQWKAAGQRRRLGQSFTCGHCGEAFDRPPTRGQRPRWCPACRDKPRLRNPDLAKAHDQRRRARLIGADAETFAPVEVFMRDGWRCGICAEAVDPALRYPDARSVSLDHVVPLSEGGHHTRANTRCSHLACNVRRGVGRTPDQLRLVG